MSGTTYMSISQDRTLRRQPGMCNCQSFELHTLKKYIRTEYLIRY